MKKKQLIAIMRRVSKQLHSITQTGLALALDDMDEAIAEYKKTSKWIEHTGDRMPEAVAERDSVTVKLRNGATRTGAPGSFSWWTGTGADGYFIKAYKISK